jgi:hypothetical protein
MIMVRGFILAAVGVEDVGRRTVEAGKTYDFYDVFRGNQRACVIVEGDHRDQRGSLTLKVTDGTGNFVASDGGGDCLAVIWYPSKNQRYRISITNNGASANQLDIVVK